MSSQRAFTLLGVAAAGGVGYYLYNAGGDPKAAQKKMEGILNLSLYIASR